MKMTLNIKLLVKTIANKYFLFVSISFKYLSDNSFDSLVKEINSYIGFNVFKNESKPGLSIKVSLLLEIFSS